MPNGGGHPSCRLCKWADREMVAGKPSFDAYCRKHETQIVLAGDFFCVDLAMPEPPVFLAEENVVPQHMYMWTEVVYAGMYYSDIVLFAPIADYKFMQSEAILRKVREINRAKQIEFEASHKQPSTKPNTDDSIIQRIRRWIFRRKSN